MKLYIIPIVLLLIVAAVVVRSRLRRSPSPTAQRPSDTDFPPKPEWKPNIPVDVDRVAKTFLHYTDNKVTFAVFENGTCVPFDSESSQPEEDAQAVLEGLFHQHPDFKPISMDDGNWTVTYSDAAYSICFADVIESNWKTIDENHLRALATAEVLLNANQEPNVFDKRGKIGLFGRARWFMDCQDPKVVRIVRPDGQPSTEGDGRKPLP